MIEIIYQWIKTIIIYLIIITVIQNLLPQGRYVKYLKVFTGLILIVIIIQPITSLVGLDKKLDNNLFESQFKLSQEELMKDYEKFNNQQKNLIVDSMKEQIEAQIKFILEQDEIYVKSVNVEIEDDDINNLDISRIDIVTTMEEVKKSETIKIDKIIIEKNNSTEVKTGEEIVFEKKIRNLLINFYNVPSNNIYITIQ